MGLNWVTYKEFRERLVAVRDAKAPSIAQIKEIYVEMVDRTFSALEEGNLEEGLVYLDAINSYSEADMRGFLQEGTYGDFLNTITKINSGDF